MERTAHSFNFFMSRSMEVLVRPFTQGEEGREGGEVWVPRRFVLGGRPLVGPCITREFFINGGQNGSTVEEVALGGGLLSVRGRALCSGSPLSLHTHSLVVGRDPRVVSEGPFAP